MITVTQLVYIRPGAEMVFDEFEDHAIPLISKHHGKLLLRLRPASEAVIASTIELPYEIHFVEFASVEDFESYKQDPTRQAFLYLKDQSVASSTMYVSQ